MHFSNGVVFRFWSNDLSFKEKPSANSEKILNLDDSAADMLSAWDIYSKLKDLSSAGAEKIVSSYSTVRPWLVWLYEKMGKNGENEVKALEKVIAGEGLGYLIPYIAYPLTFLGFAYYFGLDPSKWSWLTGSAFSAVRYVLTKALEYSGTKEKLGEVVQKRMENKLLQFIPTRTLGST